MILISRRLHLALCISADWSEKDIVVICGFYEEVNAEKRLFNLRFECSSSILEERLLIVDYQYTSEYALLGLIWTGRTIL